MKNILLTILLLTSCTANTTKTIIDGIDITTINGAQATVDLTVPKNPQKVALLDYVMLDTMLSLGLEDKITGMPSSSIPPHIKNMITRTDIPNLGGLKEIDMEKLMSIQPEIIFTSGRTTSRYDEFSPIAPTVNTSIDYTKGTMESFKTLTRRNASIFGKSDEVEIIISSYEQRLQILKEKAVGKTVIIGIMTGGSLKTLGNNSRGSIISKDIGFQNLAENINSTHGNTSSFELLVKLDPDYIFVLDRDTAISSVGSSSAQQLMNNELVYKTKAYQNNNIIYLDPYTWYLSEGGIKSMDIMLSDIEKAFN